MSKGALPKYTIRLVLIWILPLLGFLGAGLWFPWVLAGLLTPLEVPKVRQRLLSPKLRKQLPCLKVPALMRLSVLWVLQVWWFILWRAPGSSATADAGSLAAAADAVVWPDGSAPLGGAAGGGAQAWAPQTLSVVLPCASEGEYALNTVKSVHSTVPAGVLQEIIVVDDGSDPPLQDAILSGSVQQQYGVRIIRHDKSRGLIQAKKAGGDAATGDIIVFFDCHVAPQPGWHSSFLRLVSENYRRIVVPVITDLDVGTWRQKGGNKGQAKCYMTWDADFKWYHSDEDWVPILSGGLLGISARWWNETGGYDENMIGWGGENLDQSLRTWLCGGEIMMAKDAYVAHMWRSPNDPRTEAKYPKVRGAANFNRMRAASAWYGNFAEKLKQFPGMHPDQTDRSGRPWFGSLENILSVKRSLQCRSFAWFLHRFKNVYEDAGLVPGETFAIRAGSGLCLTYDGLAGTSPNGHGRAELRPCDPENERQRWHLANWDAAKPGKPCCSGLRAWNTDQCLSGSEKGGASTFVCDISGRTPDQAWSLDSEGLLRKRGGGFMSSSCLEADIKGTLKVKGCRGGLSLAGAPQWSKHLPAEPIETQIYRRAIADGEAEGV